MQSETHNVFRYVTTFFVLLWETFCFKITLKYGRLQLAGRISWLPYPLLLLHASNWMKYVPLLFVPRTETCLSSACIQPKLDCFEGCLHKRMYLCRWNNQQIQVVLPLFYIFITQRGCKKIQRITTQNKHKKSCRSNSTVRKMAELSAWRNHQAMPQQCLVAVACACGWASLDTGLQGRELAFHPSSRWWSALSNCCSLLRWLWSDS